LRKSLINLSNFRMVKLELRREKLLKKEKDIIKKLRRRLINELLDIIILNRVESNSSITGYAIIEYLFRRFNILVSSGTVYSTLYALEREGLIVGSWKGRKRIYKITPYGEEIIKTLREKSDIISSLFQEIMTQHRTLLYKR